MLDLPFLSRPASTTPPQSGTTVSWSPGNSQPTNLTVNQVVSAELQQLQTAKNQALYTQLSEEEHQTVMDKLKNAVRQPAGHLPRQDELYLEQQLTDMLGFEVTAELENIRLNHSIGIMAGVQHLKRHPNDDLNHHDTYREAGLSPYRSSFGWFTEMGQMTPKTTLQEKYFFTVQADFLPTWTQQSAMLKPWFKFRKMIMINPVSQKAVIGVVGDLGPGTWMQEQFGGSPEVIREGEVWNLESQGRVMLLFLNDPENSIALGPRDIRYNTLNSQHLVGG
jgi:hypothetical protein